MNTTPDSISRTLIIEAPLARVWQALTDADEVAKWFGSGASFEAVPGTLGHFEWQDGCEGRYALRVEEAEPMRYFAWRWMQKADVGFEEQASTLVEWRLTPLEHHKTQLELLETGFANAEQHQANVEGWDQELADLGSYLQPACA